MADIKWIKVHCQKEYQTTPEWSYWIKIQFVWKVNSFPCMYVCMCVCLLFCASVRLYVVDMRWWFLWLKDYNFQISLSFLSSPCPTTPLSCRSSACELFIPLQELIKDESIYLSKWTHVKVILKNRHLYAIWGCTITITW